MDITTRRAIPLDIDWLLQELKQFSAFFDSKIPLFEDEAYVRELILGMITDHVFFVAEKDIPFTVAKEQIGFIAGYAVPHIFNPRIRVLTETFWWVKEAYRGGIAGGKAALLLLDRFVEHGRAHADWIMMALESVSPVNPDCLTKRGFKIKERSFLMEAI